MYSIDFFNIIFQKIRLRSFTLISLEEGEWVDGWESFSPKICKKVRAGFSSCDKGMVKVLSLVSVTPATFEKKVK